MPNVAHDILRNVIYDTMIYVADVVIITFRAGCIAFVGSFILSNGTFRCHRQMRKYFSYARISQINLSFLKITYFENPRGTFKETVERKGTSSEIRTISVTSIYRVGTYIHTASGFTRSHRESSSC